MTDLYRTTVAELLEAADRLATWAQAGLDLAPSPSAVTPSAPKGPAPSAAKGPALSKAEGVARDQTGAYWLYDPRVQRWHRHTPAGWQLAAQPPTGPLEAPASPALLSDRQTAQALGALGPQGPPPGDPTPQQALSHAVASLRQSYEQGHLSSDDATEIAARMALLDRQGCFWMPGFWSGDWHRFHTGDWREAEPPAVDALVRLDEGPRPCDTCRAQLASGLICPACGEAVPPTVVALQPPGAPLSPEQADRVLIGVAAYMIGGLGTLPEPVAAEWDPPADRPQKSTPESVACPACAHQNPRGSRFCNACGRPLAPPPAPSMPPPPQPESVRCPHCGAALAPEQAFCSQCGQAVRWAEEPAASRFCPSCGQPADPEQAFCAHCGQSLRSP